MLARLADQAQLQAIEDAAKTLKNPGESTDFKGKTASRSDHQNAVPINPTGTWPDRCGQTERGVRSRRWTDQDSMRMPIGRHYTPPHPREQSGG